MTKKEVLNYMVTCEGYINFFENSMEEKDYKKIELEWDLITDSLLKDGEITAAQFRTWKRPSLKEIEKAIEESGR